MPSSSDDVATRQRSAPAFSGSSISRARLARQRAVVGAGDLAAGQLVQPQREALRQAPVVDEHERRRCSSTSSQQPRVDRRPDGRVGRRVAVHARSATWLGRARSCRRPARRTSRSSSLRGAGVDDRRPSRSPPTNRATSSSGRCVADSPMRCTSRPAVTSRRSSDSARCAPRLVAATACTSSTITVVDGAQHLARVRRGEQQVQRLRRGDQDVGRRGAASPARSALRRVAGAHADARSSGSARPSRSAAARMPASGPRRLRSTS